MLFDVIVCDPHCLHGFSSFWPWNTHRIEQRPKEEAYKSEEETAMYL